jgi:signal transduction histidine kinase
MRSIFSRLFLSFSLIILISGLISALVFFSFSRRSDESFRHDFLRQIQTNIARSVVLMGQAAYAMQEHRGKADFEEYMQEIQSSMRTQLYLCVNDTVMPEDKHPDQIISKLAASANSNDQPTIQVTGNELIVVQRLFAPDGQPYVVVGLHQLKPPPGWDGGPPPLEGPGPRLPPHPRPEGPGPGFHPPPGEGDFFSFWNGPEFHTFVLLLIAGVVCFKLAKSFSAPLAQLRMTSRQIAGGDLTARVGNDLAKPGSEIGELARDFDHMAERMEWLVNAQKRLLLDISHELRSPLTRLNIALELAKIHFQTGNDENLKRIARESERLNNLIGQLLTLARNEGYTIDVKASSVPLADLVLEIANDVNFENRDRAKEIKIITLETITMPGSSELLRQAIENIVRNGAYYTRPDSQVEVSLFAHEDSETGKHTAVIRVRDHGPGVPEEKIPHLLEPFYRVAEARDRNSGGTGLGLAIAHQAVQQHGGSLCLFNAPDREGLIVEINLPLPY